LVLPFWYWLTQVVLEKRPLNGCSSSTSKGRVEGRGKRRGREGEGKRGGKVREGKREKGRGQLSPPNILA